MIYNYNKDNLSFTNTQDIVYDPLEGLPMIPANATLIKAEPKDGFIPIFNEGFDRWDYIENLIGEWYEIATLTPVEITVGDCERFSKVKDLYTNVKPPSDNKEYTFNSELSQWETDENKEKEKKVNGLCGDIDTAIADKTGNRALSSVRLNACLEFIAGDKTKANDLLLPVANALSLTLFEYVDLLMIEVRLVSELERDSLILKIELTKDVMNNVAGGIDNTVSSFIETRVKPLNISLI